MTVAFGSAGSIISSASAATLTPVLPAVDPSGLYLAMIAVGNNATINTPASWSKLFQTNSGTLFSAALYLIKAAGPPANPVFTWTGATACMAQAISFTGVATNVGGPFGGSGGPSAGTTNPHTSASHTSTAPDSLGVACDFQKSSTAQPSIPAGWTAALANGDATAGMAFAAWTKQLGVTGTASGAISQNQTAVAWVEAQIELLDNPSSEPHAMFRVKQGWRY